MSRDIPSHKRAAGLIFLFCLFIVAAPASATRQVALPRESIDWLDANFPGWQLKAVDTDTRRDFLQRRLPYAPNFIMQDFSGDGVKDYAALIVYEQDGGDRQAVVAFVSEGDRHEPHVLDALDAADGYDFLIMHEKGSESINYEYGGKIRYRHNTVGGGFTGATGVVFVFDGKRFRRVIVLEREIGKGSR